MEVRLINSNPLFDYKEACMITQNKVISTISVPENEIDYWIKQIIANHSTIRSVKFRVIDSIPRSCIMQIIRATKGHPQPFVASSRPDWNDGKERSNNPYEEKLFAMDFTPEAFIEMCKQRLCIRTEARTREVVKGWVEQFKNSTNPVISAIGYCCKPVCEWYNGCPELKGCGKYPQIAEKIIHEKE